jgi:LacI family transcriptional regulator
VSSKIPTINDVAEAAGVSKRTVSRVINKSDKVNEKTRAEVEAVIRKLNFSPNRQARGLAARRSYLLGLVYDLPTLFIADIQQGILGVCSDLGFELVVHSCRSDQQDPVSDVLSFVQRAKVDGLIVLPPVSELEAVSAALNEAGCRYVQFSSGLSGEPWKQVVTHYKPAITEMTRYLISLGHERFGFISGPRNNLSSRKRQEAFTRALSDSGFALQPEFIAEGAFTYESGERGAEELLSRSPRPTAIFAANDEMAFGVMNVANRMGIRLPEDLSVVGFDGTAFSQFVIPSLSTIRRQPHEMARLGTQKLIALINEGEDAARKHETMVSPQFVPRDSTGPAPGR